MTMVNHPTRSKQQQAQHTPGPWTYETHELSEGFSSIVYDANGYRVGTDHLSEPDARLIAAAPDLLAALKDVLGDKPGDLNDDYECVGCGRDYDFSELKRDACCPAEDCPRHNARAAIAKAEGR